MLCVVPGEIWGGAVLRYFSALEEGINLLPGFAPELQGVYIEEHDGRKQVWCYVIKPRDAQSTLLKGENDCSINQPVAVMCNRCHESWNTA